MHVAAGEFGEAGGGGDEAGEQGGHRPEGL